MSSDNEPSITPEMRTRYLQRRQADIEALQSAFSIGDFATMKSIAHNIKGNAATFSYEDLERLAADLEQSAESASREACERIIESMKAWLATEAI